ncbi:MAG: leucine-rich repeat protein, partial [bacterium]
MFVLIVFVMMVSLRPAGVCAEAIEGTPGTAGGFTEAVRGKLELSEEKTAELLAKVYAEELSRNGEETDAESAAEQLAGESEGISRNETEASAEPSAKQPSGEETDAESAAEQPSGEETDAESVAVSQAGEAASGMCGDGLSWAYDGKGTLTVSGEGEMWEFSETETPWKDFRANVEKVVVKSGAASIGDSAFMDCRNLVRATLPKSLQSIGSAAFMNCSKLASVSVPKGVEIVG